MINKDFLYKTLAEMFPNAKCELNYNNIFELLVSVILSAQTTDISVNKVTKNLFSKYNTISKLANAKEEDVKEVIKTIGLSNTKAKNIIKLSQILIENYDSTVPKSFEELLKLPGVGRKTANVLISEGYKIPGIAVDTHVLRVSNRLGLVSSSNPEFVEDKLKNIFEKERWNMLHLYLLFFGRYHCKAKKPNCLICPFIADCVYYKKQAQ
ncbi:MAG: endonuclease III [Bacilli bacterium]|nr:endonuclease III [Bacilli bacterium]